MNNFNMCRICMTEDVRMQYLLSTNLLETYEKLSGVPFETKFRPLQVCYMCYAKLQNCYQLRVSCLHSEKMFKQMSEDTAFKPTVLWSVKNLEVAVQSKENYSFQDSLDPVGEKVETNDPITTVQVKVEVFDEEEEKVECNRTDVEVTMQSSEQEGALDNGDAGIEYNEALDYTLPVINMEDYVSCEINELGTENDVKLEHSVKTTESIGVAVPKQLQQTEREDSTNVGETETIKLKINKKLSNKPESDEEYTVKKRVYKPRKVPRILQHQCAMCDKFFGKKSNLARHMRIHTGERPFKCDICQKQFSHKQHLIAHSRTHTKEKPHECVICGKCFGLKQHLSNHIRRHTSEKPYKCAVCEKCFKQKGDLAQHAVIHFEKRPYKCHICQRTFTQNGGLSRHIRTHR